MGGARDETNQDEDKVIRRTRKRWRNNSALVIGVSWPSNGCRSNSSNSGQSSEAMKSARVAGVDATELLKGAKNQGTK